MVSLVISASCRANAPSEATTAPPGRVELGSEYRIQPGDRLTIMVVNHPVHSMKRVEVGEDGTIEVPSFGRVRVAGLTAAELKHHIRMELKKIREHRSVFVIVQEIERAR